MEYLNHFNNVCDALEANGVQITYDLSEALRTQVKANYKQAFKEGAKSVDANQEDPYKEGRMVGYNLGYKEGLEAGKVAKKQRLLNAYGGR